MSLAASAQKIPLVYDVENTAAALPAPLFPNASELPYSESLPDPLALSDGKGRALKFSQWKKRRGEIANEIQHYEIGRKPAVPLDSIDASMHGDTLKVIVHRNGKTLALTSTISYPAGGKAPYPLMIGADIIALPRDMFTSRNIATMVFHARQVNGYSQFGKALTVELTPSTSYIRNWWAMEPTATGLGGSAGCSMDCRSSARR